MDEEVLDENLAAKGQHRFFKNGPFYIWGAILLAGLLLYVVRGPFQSLFILIGSAGLTAYSWHGFFRANERTVLNTSLSILGLCWLVYFLFGALLNGGQPFNFFGLGFYGTALIFTLLTNQLRYNSNRKKHERSN